MLSAKQFAPFGLVIGCVIFGLGSVIVAHVPIGSYAIAFWRLAVAAIIFAVLSRFFAQKMPQQPKVKRLALMAGAFLGIDLSLWHESIHSVGPGISTVLNCLQLFWLTGISICFFKEKLSIAQIGSLILAIAGVVLIVSPELNHNHHGLWGLISGLLSGLMLALSMVCVQKIHKITKTPIFPLMFWISIGGMMMLIAPVLWLDWGKILPRSWEQIAWILVYGSLMQCFAWGMIAYAIPLLTLSLSGLLLLSEPIAALLIDFIFLDKAINITQWFGTMITLLAIYWGSMNIASKTH